MAERYRELMSPLNVTISLEKSLVSSVGALEFAKRFFVGGVTKDLSPVSCRMLRSLFSSISLVSVMRAIRSTSIVYGKLGTGCILDARRLLGYTGIGISSCFTHRTLCVPSLFG